MELYLGFKDCDGYDSRMFMGETSLLEKLICISSIAYVFNCKYQVKVFAARFKDNYVIDKKDIKKAQKIIKKKHINTEIRDVKYFLENINKKYSMDSIIEIKKVFLKYNISFIEDTEKCTKQFFRYNDFVLQGTYDNHLIYGKICITPDYFKNTFYDSFKTFKKLFNTDVIKKNSQQLSNVCNQFNPEFHQDANIRLTTNPNCCGCRIFSYNNLYASERAIFEKYNMEDIQNQQLIIVVHAAILNNFLNKINNKCIGWELYGFEIVGLSEGIECIIKYYEPPKNQKLNSWI